MYKRYQCGHCGETSNTRSSRMKRLRIKCNYCCEAKEADANVIPTRFCSVACLTAGWERHQRYCPRTAIRHLCAHCGGRFSHPLLGCNACKRVHKDSGAAPPGSYPRYCGRRCQKHSWTYHRLQCAMYNPTAGVDSVEVESTRAPSIGDESVTELSDHESGSESAPDANESDVSLDSDDSAWYQVLEEVD